MAYRWITFSPAHYKMSDHLCGAFAKMAKCHAIEVFFFWKRVTRLWCLFSHLCGFFFPLSPPLFCADALPGWQSATRLRFFFFGNVSRDCADALPGLQSAIATRLRCFLLICSTEIGALSKRI